MKDITKAWSKVLKNTGHNHKGEITYEIDSELCSVMYSEDYMRDIQPLYGAATLEQWQIFIRDMNLNNPIVYNRLINEYIKPYSTLPKYNKNSNRFILSRALLYRFNKITYLNVNKIYSQIASDLIYKLDMNDINNLLGEYDMQKKKYQNFGDHLNEMSRIRQMTYDHDKNKIINLLELLDKCQYAAY